MYWLCLHFIVVCLDVVTFSIDIIICANCACEILTYSKNTWSYRYNSRGAHKCAKLSDIVPFLSVVHRAPTHTALLSLSLSSSCKITNKINRYRVSSEKSVTHLHDANGFTAGFPPSVNATIPARYRAARYPA